MLGRRQLQILECLELGSISIPALMLRMGAHDPDQRDRIYALLARLEGQGLVRVVDRGHGNHNMAGVIVERADDGRPSSPPPWSD